VFDEPTTTDSGSEEAHSTESEDRGKKGNTAKKGDPKGKDGPKGKKAGEWFRRSSTQRDFPTDAASPGSKTSAWVRKMLRRTILTDRCIPESNTVRLAASGNIQPKRGKKGNTVEKGEPKGKGGPKGKAKASE
jgi:hypothetical protein